MKMSRRRSIEAAVRKALKAQHAFLAPEVLDTLIGGIDVAHYYRIEVIRDVARAAARTMLTNDVVSRCVGTSGCQEEYSPLVGDVTVGEVYTSDNVIEHVEKTVESRFDAARPFAGIIQCHDWREFEGDWQNHDDTTYTIVVYVPAFAA